MGTNIGASWSASYLPKSIEIEPDRLDFINELEKICIDERATLSRNPIMSLITTTAEEWSGEQARFATEEATKPRDRFQFRYIESSNHRAAENRILDDWARIYSLLFEAEPARWIVEHARRRLNHDKMPYHPKPNYTFSSEPFSPSFPSRKPGESDGRYAKRLLQIGKEFERDVKEHRKQVRQSLPPRLPGRPTGMANPLDHRSLIYLICGRPRASVAATLGISDSSVTRRARRVAKKIGIDYPHLPLPPLSNPTSTDLYL